MRLTIRRKLFERKVKKTRESILTQRRQPYFVEEAKGPAEEADELVVPGSLPIRRRIAKKVKKRDKLIKLDQIKEEALEESYIESPEIK